MNNCQQFSKELRQGKAYETRKLYTKRGSNPPQRALSLPSTTPAMEPNMDGNALVPIV
jgi:hypothetical protein